MKVESFLLLGPHEHYLSFQPNTYPATHKPTKKSSLPKVTLYYISAGLKVSLRVTTSLNHGLPENIL